MRRSLITILSLLMAVSAAAQTRPRARDLGVPFQGTPGPLDAITDVRGVQVGFTTLISGEGKLVVGKGPVRTGVTAILPRGKASANDPVYAGWFSQNGNGEMTGTTWVEESGFLEGPVMITNTHSIGAVHEGTIDWRVKHGAADAAGYWWSNPVVAETYDGHLNDINGFHVRPEHAQQALDNAKPGPVAEGNVGGGTGMICYEFKGGTGSASRLLSPKLGGYTVGVLVQCNCGARPQLTIAGVPVGREIPEHPAYGDQGSIIIVVATDAPLLPNQLRRIARRATMGLARTGSTAGNGSGDIFIAFSTANSRAWSAKGLGDAKFVPNEEMNPLFDATVEATEEAIINAMVGAQTMTGADNYTVIELPHDRLCEVLKKYNRLNPGK
jgi:D-aminopeptidase